MKESETSPGLAGRLGAWGVHLFTASGIITVFMAILAVGKGDLRAAMLWLVAAQLIDGVDGTMARRFRVTEVLPFMNGKNIDFVIDFASYAIVPAYMIYASGLIGGDWNLACAFLILMVSAVYYGKEGMISEDYYFIGFPVMWNMAAFFMIFVFQWGHWANVLLVVALSALHFIPIKFAYPSRTNQWRWLSLGVAAAGMLAALGIIWPYPEPRPVLNAIANLALGYFGFFALWVTYFKR